METEIMKNEPNRRAEKYNEWNEKLTGGVPQQI
jgi:hypothetical protein